MRPPMRSLQASDLSADTLPWQDVMIDVQGPFTRSEGGEQYVLTYMCTRLKVPRLSTLTRLQAGHFSRALVRCIISTRMIPDIIRSDRGPEMVNRINAEFLALLEIKHIKGASLTPRHQGLV